MAFTDFLSQLSANPIFLVTVLLTLGVIFVNGWTDAPNAIATCVSTRAMSPRAAILMAAFFNFLGVLFMSIIGAKVTATVMNMVNFNGDNHDAIVALCAALLAIVIWAVAAWYFGIPTSESHALIAGISGAAIALQGNFSGINGSEWVKVLYGILVSTLLGFFIGWLFTKLTILIFRRSDRRKTTRIFKKAQVLGGASMAFMHGAQDGLKFMGVMMLGMLLVKNEGTSYTGIPPMWLMVLCSAVMAIGTSIGGYKIIKAVGMDMVKLEQYQGFSADMSASLILLLCTLIGYPVSTTHTKTTAIMGVGASKRLSSVNWGVVKEMVFTWIFTFPGCGLLGYLFALVFMKIF
ncbi:MAG: inorganic phosphate transporter [Eubacteriales bacterium]|nr:inorganic phosphate transporter [Eubacteriales bacterium]